MSDETRSRLLSFARSQARVIVTSSHDDAECVSVGRVVKVAREFVTIQLSRGAESVIPIAHVSDVAPVVVAGAEKEASQ